MSVYIFDDVLPAGDAKKVENLVMNSGSSGIFIIKMFLMKLTSIKKRRYNIKQFVIIVR